MSMVDEKDMSQAAGALTLDTLLNSSVDGIITIDQSGAIETVNPAAARMFQYGVEEFIGRNVKFLMPEPFCSEHDGYLHSYITTGTRKIIGIGREVIGRRKDGSTFPMHLSVGEFAIDGKSFFTGIIHDLSERKQADAMATRLGRVLEGSVNEVYVFDADTLRFLTVNKGARRNLGYSEEELGKLTPVDIKPDFDMERFQDMIAPLRSGEQELLQFETIHRRKDGTDYDVGINLQLYQAEDPPVFVAIILDITERRQIERALRQAQKMEAIGQLTGGIAHDFNNLLTVIVGNLELLEMRVSDPEVLDLVNEAQEAADFGARLTSRLLAFARNSQLEPKVIDLNALALSLTDLLQRTLGETISLNSAFSTDLWPIKIDPSQLESAIVNLAVNARDAMPAGGKLVLETRNITIVEGYEAVEIGLNRGDYVQLSITDTGEGMSQNVRERAFEPFFTTKDVGRGTGLGLSMVYGFAKQSGGHMTIYSEIGMGTTVNLYLPCHQALVVPEESDNGSSGTALGDGELILVVEDNEAVRRLTMTRLKGLGYRVLDAADGVLALEVLESHPEIDLVFTDLVMPGGVSGYDLCKDARKRWPGIRVLLTSGYAEELTHGDKLEAENLRLLRKPYRQTVLAQSIREALNET